MKYFLLSIYILVFVSCSRPKTTKQLTVNSISVFKKFQRAGSTMSLLGEFHHPQFHKTDSSNVFRLPASYCNEVDKILANANRGKHLQTKLAGVLYGAELYDSQGRKHEILLFHKKIVDLTDRYNYLFTEEDFKNTLDVIDQHWK